MESVKVTCANDEETMTFGMVIVKKCQNAFEMDKARHQVADKFSDIDSCIDPVIYILFIQCRCVLECKMMRKKQFTKLSKTLISFVFMCKDRRPYGEDRGDH